MNSERVLQLLQDVEGVVGSFVSDRAGELQAGLSPPEFSEAALKRTASRVGRIVRCAELCELDVERCELRLGKHQLLIFCFESGLLGVLVQPPVSKRALAMAARLAIRELAALPPGAQLEPEDEDEVTSQYPSARRSSG
jgi:hypothetical protein